MTETDRNGEWKHTNVYLGDMLVATYDDDGAHFHLTDWLGTRRVQTDYLGRVEDTYPSLPFGEFLPSNNTADLGATEQHFTRKERDTESGNDYFGARYYASMGGRFLSPDWSSSAASVPFASIDNPQTLNLYAYVGNNPLSVADHDGHGWLQSLSEALRQGFSQEHENDLATSHEGCQGGLLHGPWLHRRRPLRRIGPTTRKEARPYG